MQHVAFQAIRGGVQLRVTPSPFGNKLCLLASSSRSEVGGVGDVGGSAHRINTGESLKH